MIKREKKLLHKEEQDRSGSKKLKKGKPGPQFWKEGAGKGHLNVHFSVFLIIESFEEFFRKGGGGGAAPPTPPLNPLMQDLLGLSSALYLLYSKLSSISFISSSERTLK